MVTTMFLIGAAVVAAFAYGVDETSRTKQFLAKATAKSKFPKSIGTLVTMAEVTQLMHTIEKISVVGVIACLALFAIALTLKSGTEGEMY